MVNLTRIYTRTGDAGMTRLADMSVVPKTDPRVQAYGDVDEANCVIGVVRAHETLPPEIDQVLAIIQNELFDVGSDLATPLAAQPGPEPLRILPTNVTRLENWIDEFGAGLPAMRSFILPGGTVASSLFHLARTVVRRAERSAWIAFETYSNEVSESGNMPGGVNVVALTYLNRLSDLMFVLGRVVNVSEGDVLWTPGADREPPSAEAARNRRRIAEQQMCLRTDTATPEGPIPPS